jgi:hypothetical protein
MELKQRFAILNDKKKLIKALYPQITNESGIYCFYRTDEDGQDCCYIGQAKNLLNRTAQHLMGRKQHIDKSLYVHKLYAEDNKTGWKLTVLQKCGLDELDYLEQHYIRFYSDMDNVKVYNVTGGGQYDKKSDIGERQQTKLKSYKNGKNLGYDKARDYVKVMFDKYLDYIIKGKTNKTKERKLSEFKEWLEVQNELRETND